MAGAKEETVKVILTPDLTWPDGIKKAFQSNLANGDLLTFKNNNHPGFIVNFTIDDPQNTGYLFPADKKKAMWVKKLTGAPGEDTCAKQSDTWDGFEATGVSPDFKTLTVSNPNDKIQRFVFTLRFTQNPQSGNCIDWDPGGDDRNGAANNLAKTLLIVGVVVVVGAVATNLLGLW
jgi:hypothetical protein